MRCIPSALFIAAMCGCTNEIDITQPPAQHAPSTQYQIVKLPSLGGALSRGSSTLGGPARDSTSHRRGSAQWPGGARARAQAWRPWRAYAALHLWLQDDER